MIVELHADDQLQGRFTMNLEEAKEYFLEKAKELGLSPEKETFKEGKYFFSFYSPMSLNILFI